MAEQLSLLNDSQEPQYIIWHMDEYTWDEINRAILRYQDRTKERPGLIAFPPRDKNKIKPLLPNRFDLGEWLTDAVKPGYIWICSGSMMNHWETRDRSYSARQGS